MPEHVNPWLLFSLVMAPVLIWAGAGWLRDTLRVRRAERLPPVGVLDQLPPQCSVEWQFSTTDSSPIHVRCRGVLPDGTTSPWSDWRPRGNEPIPFRWYEFWTGARTA